MPADLVMLMQQCAPQVAPATLRALVKVESGFNPLAININGGTRLARPAASPQEAVAWTSWLVERGYSVDVGLMQVNSANLRRLGVPIASAFDVCTNLRVGAGILAGQYQRSRKQGADGDAALYAALSAYNTGHFSRGIANGYVGKVLAASGAPAPAALSIPPLTVVGRKPSAHAGRAPSSFHADSEVTGFGQASTQFSQGS